MPVQKIILRSKQDVAYWTDFFAVTEHRLRLAIQQAGASLLAVERYFAEAQASAALSAPPKKAAPKKRANASATDAQRLEGCA